MVRINELHSVDDADDLDVSNLDALFLDRGMSYLSKYVHESVRLYDSMQDVDHLDYHWEYNIRGVMAKPMAYIVTVLCVYLAIKDLVEVFDFLAAYAIAEKLWFGDKITDLWDLSPYSVAIRLASNDCQRVWKEMMYYRALNNPKGYLSYVHLFDIHKDACRLSCDQDGYGSFAQEAIRSAFDKEDVINYASRW